MCLIFLYTHREFSNLSGELWEESDRFRFLLTVFWANLKDSVGLIFSQTLDNDSGSVFLSTYLRGLSAGDLLSSRLIRVSLSLSPPPPPLSLYHNTAESLYWMHQRRFTPPTVIVYDPWLQHEE